VGEVLCVPVSGGILFLSERDEPQLYFFMGITGPSVCVVVFLLYLYKIRFIVSELHTHTIRELILH